MQTQEPVATVLKFIERINAGDVVGILAMMTDDHVFIDALGNRLSGKDALRAGWNGYLSWFPDYRIAHEEIFQNRDAVAAFGIASGTYAVNGKLPKENRWEVPGAWKGVVRDGKIAEWRVYCDNLYTRKLMGEKVA
ncbi:MAG TPA: nuclear transport factor 2 family protein [Candidatus Acidoferrales bacterium]|jgi:ketosteroid isomerase-like protein|nr:nuclear transport factor 2 family protein [Candidatus Acidoferrales bacterium]